ncbi:hypothetical protein VME0621_05131 [Vibrio mediterranei]|uniref:hypothetical protein n=1 Tax=Vibrio mediterranei TaxID=689 RepID=UPI000785824B|nr:hypothetical protein [Vibrio mediterranei]SBO12960.1 hypothetical protein VME0621_05131 [Vibrio mediterranei]
MKRKLLILGLILSSFYAVASARLQVAEALLARERAVQFGSQMLKVETAVKAVSPVSRPYFVTPSNVSMSSFGGFLKSMSTQEPVKTVLAALGFAVSAGNWEWSSDYSGAPKQGSLYSVQLSQMRYTGYGVSIHTALKNTFAENAQNYGTIDTVEVAQDNTLVATTHSGWRYVGSWVHLKCDSATSTVESCAPDYVPSQADKTIPDDAFAGTLASRFSSLSDTQKQALFQNADGSLADLDWQPEATAEPTFSDGRPLPPIGDPLWQSALDHSQGKTVPEDKAADARYLAETVAQNDSTVLNKNANGSSGGTNPNPDNNVDLSPVVNAIQSLESSNANELKAIKEQLKANAKAPDLDKAGEVSCLVGLKCPSFVDLKYGDGLKGLLDDFKTQISASKLLQFLDDFRVNGNGNVTPPVWIIDLSAVDFLGEGLGKHDVSLPSYIWSFMRACLLFGTVMACRKIIFGG